MSDDFQVFCCSHDPAVPVGDDVGRDEIEPLIRSLRKQSAHETCDLLVGRYSGALVEIGCPCNIGLPAGSPGHKFGGGGPGYHRDMEWVDQRWLALAATLLDDTGAIIPGVSESASLKATRSCWTPQRIHRLRFILNDS